MIEEMSGDFLQWLRGFYFVAKDKSFSRAGLEIGRNQSTVSYQVKSLEKEFGLTLIDRSKSKLELTPEGGFFFQRSISIFEQIKEMRGYASRATSIIEGQIRIASTQAVISYFLARHILEFIKKHPKVTFEAEGGDRTHILAKVGSADADFGILNQESISEDFMYYNLFETKPVLIASKNYPYPIERFPTLRQIAELPFVSFAKTCTLHPWIDKQFSGEGLKLNIIMTLNNFETVKKYVEIGMGVSILEDYMLKDGDKEIFNVFPLANLFGTKGFGIVLRKRKYLSPCAKTFLKTIKPDIQLNHSLG